MTTNARPTTRKLTASEQATVEAAREAIAKGQSLKSIAFRAAETKADKAAYLQAHL